MTLGLLGGAEEGKGQGCRVGGGGLRVPVHLGLPAEPRPEAGLLSGDAGAPAAHEHPACLSPALEFTVPHPRHGGWAASFGLWFEFLGQVNEAMRKPVGLVLREKENLTNWASHC